MMIMAHAIGKKEKSAIETLPALSGEPGTETGKRLYLCKGPYCWGRGITAREAVRNAAKNCSSAFEGEAGWRWVMYDVPSDAWVDRMGSICAGEREANAAIHKMGSFGMNWG